MSIDQTTCKISALDMVSNTFQSEALRGMKRKVADTTLELEQATWEHEVEVARLQDDAKNATYIAKYAQDSIDDARVEIRTVMLGLGDVLPSSVRVLQRAIDSLSDVELLLRLLQPRREALAPAALLPVESSASTAVVPRTADSDDRIPPAP